MNQSNSPRFISDFSKSNAYRARVHDFIAGGAHTYSKGDDQYPVLSPAAIARGKGGRVWDLDGNDYVDCLLALGAVSLGHAYEPVLDAVRAQLDAGSAYSRPASIELELAEAFLAGAPGMDRIKFAKNGSNVTTAAVKLARAFTGRDLVAFPSDHPFYSFDDWFIGQTKATSGVPDLTRRLAVTYPSHDPDALQRLFEQHPGQISCVISEPEEVIPQSPDIIRSIEAITKRNGALFIVDEMVTGYRSGFPGSYVGLGLKPDLATWGKAVGNGFSFCALTGRAEVMELGGLRQSEQPRVFLLSSTHGGEAHALAAALAVIREYQQKPVLEYQHKCVATIAACMRAAVAAAGLEKHIQVENAPWRVVVLFRDAGGQISSPFRTLFMQEMIGRGVLFQGVYLPCFTHTAADLDRIIEAFNASCRVYAQALEQGAEQFLIGEAARPVFRKYNGCSQVCATSPCPHETTCRQT